MRLNTSILPHIGYENKKHVYINVVMIFKDTNIQLISHNGIKNHVYIDTMMNFQIKSLK